MAFFLTMAQFLAMIFGFAYSIWRLKKYKSIGFDVRQGMRCYGCSEKIDKEIDYSMISLQSEHMALCVCCDRDEKLDSFVKSGFPSTTFMNKTRKYLFSKKSDKLVWYLLLAICLSTILEITLRLFFGIKIFWIIGPIFNIIYWSIFSYRAKIAYIKE